jgi:hypothetical protein
MDGYLSKPVNLSRLRETLAAWLNPPHNTPNMANGNLCWLPTPSSCEVMAVS